jgi:hypothetical protein
MIHHSCDRCKRVIDPDSELRYLVRLEIEAIAENFDELQAEDDRDHLLEIDEVLERLDDAEDPNIAPEVYQRRRYDLCPECARKLISNPLGRDQVAKMGFSSN